MGQELYFVYFDGYDGGYGADFYLLGVFDTEDKANDAIKNAKCKFNETEDGAGDRFRAFKVILNKTYDDIKYDKYLGYVNDMYIGGYME